MKKTIEKCGLFSLYALDKPPVEDVKIDHIKMRHNITGQI